MVTAVKEKVTKNKGNRKAVPMKAEEEKLCDANIFAQRVEKKAYEIFQRRGCQNGHDLDDWLEAEKLVEAEMIGMD